MIAIICRTVIWWKIFKPGTYLYRGWTLEYSESVQRARVCSASCSPSFWINFPNRSISHSRISTAAVGSRSHPIARHSMRSPTTTTRLFDSHWDWTKNGRSPGLFPTENRVRSASTIQEPSRSLPKVTTSTSRAPATTLSQYFTSPSCLLPGLRLLPRLRLSTPRATASGV